MGYDIFETEQQVLEAGRKALQRGQMDDNDWSTAFASLLGSYEELFKQTKGVIRLSDLNQKKLNELSASLEAQNSLLEHQKTDLAAAKDQVEQKVQERTRELVASQEKINRLIEVGIALSAERNSKLLMEQILLEAKELTNADGGTLYILDDDEQLRFEIIRSDSLNLTLGGASGGDIAFQYSRRHRFGHSVGPLRQRQRGHSCNSRPLPPDLF